MPEIKARFATLPRLKETVLPVFFDPMPCDATFRDMFEDVAQIKTNPNAKRGGGPVFYSVSGVEKLLQARIMGNVR